MKASISKSDERIGSAPYTELLIEWKDDEETEQEDFRITFRCYPKRVFVAVDDQRDNPFSGADLDDCFLVPPVILQRTPKEMFNPKINFLLAMSFSGYTQEMGEDLVNACYSEIDSVVKEWMEMCKLPLTPEPDYHVDDHDHWYHDNPNY